MSTPYEPTDPDATLPPSYRSRWQALPANIPHRIHGMRVLRQLGEGGSSIVCEAMQDEPRRRVAIKILKLGIQGDDAIARMGVEREALAMMDHPHLAVIYDAGYLGDNPYFVMELIDGPPIHQYCAQNQLTLGETIRLFLGVCAGIQHAHSKGIIHRDISAKNVLVAQVDGHAVAKVIDFGVAKVLGRPLTDSTPVTIPELLPVTMEYMSPEQAAGDMSAVDFSTDVYALGVLLYELLTGSLPFESSKLRSASHLERIRLITEVDPPSICERLSERSSGSIANSSDDAPATPSSTDGTRSWSPERLRGELDWITQKAMAKDRSDRYETPRDLAQDLHCYLTNQPVAAAPPSRLYQLKKWYVRQPAYAWSVTLGVVLAHVLVVVLAAAYFEVRDAYTDSKETNQLLERDRNRLASSEQSLRSAMDQNRLLHRTVYAGRIGQVGEMIRRGQILPAKNSLNACQPDLRGWEWYYLASLVDSSDRVLGQSASGFSAVAYHAKAHLIVAGTRDGAIWVWNQRDGRFIGTGRVHDHRITAVSVVADGRTILALDEKGSWWLGPIPTPQTPITSGERGVLAAAGRSYLEAAIEPGGTRVAYYGIAGPVVTDLRTGDSQPLAAASSHPGSLVSSVGRAWVDWPEGGGPAVLVGDEDHYGWLYSFNRDLQEQPERRAEIHTPSESGAFCIEGNRVACDLSTLRCRLAPGVALFDLPNDGPRAYRRDDARVIRLISRVNGDIALSSDARYLAVGGSEDDPAILIWDADSGEFVGEDHRWPSSIGVRNGSESYVASIAFAGSEDLLVSASWDGYVREWELPKPAPMTRLVVPADVETNLSDEQTDRIVRRVLYSSDGKLLLALRFNSAQLIDATTKATLLDLQDDWEDVIDARITSGEVRLLVVQRDQADLLEVVQPILGQTVRERAIGTFGADDVNRVARYGPAGEWVAYASSSTGEEKLNLLRLDDEQKPSRFELPVGGVQDLRIAPDGGTVAVIVKAADSETYKVQAWDLAERSLRWEDAVVATKLNKLVFTHAGDQFFVATNVDRVLIYETQTGQRKQLTTRETNVSALGVSPDDTRLAVGSESGWVRIWDLPSESALLELPECFSWVPDVAWHPDEQQLAVAGGVERGVLLYESHRRTRAQVRSLLQRQAAQAGGYFELKRRLERGDLALAEGIADSRRVEFDGQLAREVGSLSDDPDYLNRVARELVARASSKAANFEYALKMASSALEIRPDWRFRLTFGLAKFRLAQSMLNRESADRVAAVGLFRQAEQSFRRAAQDCDADAAKAIRALAVFAESHANAVSNRGEVQPADLSQLRQAISAPGDGFGGLDGFLAEASAFLATHSKLQQPAAQSP